MTILEIKEQLTKDSTAIFSFKDKHKRELNGCMYYVKQREEYVIEVYGISGQHTPEDFHAQKNEVIELKEIVDNSPVINSPVNEKFVGELKYEGEEPKIIDGPNVSFSSDTENISVGKGLIIEPAKIELPVVDTLKTDGNPKNKGKNKGKK